MESNRALFSKALAEIEAAGLRPEESLKKLAGAIRLAQEFKALHPPRKVASDPKLLARLDAAQQRSFLETDETINRFSRRIRAVEIAPFVDEYLGRTLPTPVLLKVVDTVLAA
ncbi:MAG: hypothetical protein KGI70_00670 [Patescibacteria group bacterium]|nr:hypothetical protein [Patescibacteria group bacterium]